MSGILTVFLYRSCKLFLLCIVIYIFGGGTTETVTKILLPLFTTFILVFGVYRAFSIFSERL